MLEPTPSAQGTATECALRPFRKPACISYKYPITGKSYYGDWKASPQAATVGCSFIADRKAAARAQILVTQSTNPGHTEHKPCGFPKAFGNMPKSSRATAGSLAGAVLALQVHVHVGLSMQLVHTELSAVPAGCS